MVFILLKFIIIIIIKYMNKFESFDIYLPDSINDVNFDYFMIC